MGVQYKFIYVVVTNGYIGYCLGYTNVIFRDQDIGDRCERQCETDYMDCTLACSDTNCLLDCGRALTDCVNGILILH